MHTILINNIVKDTHLAGVGSRTATGARAGGGRTGPAAGARGGGRSTGRRRPANGAAAAGERGAPMCATGRPAADVDGDGAVGGGGAMAAGRPAEAATHGQRNGRRAGENETARGSDPR
jgi:hypothetical protein